MDSAGLTPLCHATAAGNIDAMKILIEAGADVNDGSLHIAARNLDITCIKFLKNHDHDAGYPCIALDGRPPLAELCYAARGSGPRWEYRVELAIREFIPLHDVHRWRSLDGKTVLHLAIDNPTSAYPILGAFLRVSQLWRNPNRDDDYLYIDTGNYMCYSLTQYVNRLCPGKSSEERASLIHLLKSNQFVDRFYSEFGAQPMGAVGLPKELATP